MFDYCIPRTNVHLRLRATEQSSYYYHYSICILQVKERELDIIDHVIHTRPMTSSTLETFKHQHPDIVESLAEDYAPDLSSDGSIRYDLQANKVKSPIEREGSRLRGRKAVLNYREANREVSEVHSESLYLENPSYLEDPT